MRASPAPTEIIEEMIYLLRGRKVLLDFDLAVLYGVPTSRLNEQVKRNIDRFPEDFLFHLTQEEYLHLISQNAISRHGGRRKLPYAFTEQGVAMLSSVLRSPRAIQVNIVIMRTFVQLRDMLSAHKDLVKRIDNLEKKYDGNFQLVFDAIRRLVAEPDPPPKKRIGFHTHDL